MGCFAEEFHCVNVAGTQGAREGSGVGNFE